MKTVRGRALVLGMACIGVMALTTVGASASGAEGNTGVDIGSGSGDCVTVPPGCVQVGGPDGLIVINCPPIVISPSNCVV